MVSEDVESTVKLSKNDVVIRISYLMKLCVFFVTGITIVQKVHRTLRVKSYIGMYAYNLVEMSSFSHINKDKQITVVRKKIVR